MRSDVPNAVLDALGMGFSRMGTPAALLEPYVARYHTMLDTVQDKESHAIIEAIVQGFYPRTLADVALHDATQAWLDTHADADAALRRMVVENRDPITRALAAQARDADG